MLRSTKLPLVTRAIAVTLTKSTACLRWPKLNGTMNCIFDLASSVTGLAGGSPCGHRHRQKKTFDCRMKARPANRFRISREHGVSAPQLRPDAGAPSRRDE